MGYNLINILDVIFCCCPVQILHFTLIHEYIKTLRYIVLHYIWQ